MRCCTRQSWIVGAILVAALAVRLLAAWWWQERLGDPQAFGFPDSHSYWYLAEKVAAGEPYEYGGPEFRVFRAPAYPLVLAGLFRVVGMDSSVIWARGVGAVLGTLTVAAIMALGYLLFDTRVGLLSGALVALYPGAVAMSIFVLAEGLFCLAMVVQLVAWVLAWQVTTAWKSRAWAVSSGLASGLAVLTRPSWLLFVPFVLVFLVLFSRARRRHFEMGVWILVGTCVVMWPWWVRNYRAVGQFVPTTLQIGASLYDGLNPDATGASNMPFSTPFYMAQKDADKAAGADEQGFEVRLDRRLRDAAVKWAMAHPSDVVRLMGQKLVRMWNVWPNADEFRSWPLRLVVAAGYVPLGVAGAVGFWCWGRRGWPFVLCGFPVLYFTGLHVVFVSSIRYREPAMLVWSVLAAAALVGGCSRWCRAPDR
jgi:4-amino-4-deoxy-L-arabinose transferase-like glycosyltransferase